MKHFSLVVFFLHLFLCNLVFALFSLKELEIFNVFVKPYGISLKLKDDVILKVSQNLGKCSAFNATFKDCNSIFGNFTSSTTENERSKLTSLWKNCPSGSYSCYAVKSDSLLKRWFVKVQSTMKDLCKEKCWQTLEQLVKGCTQSGKSGIKESDRTYIQFVNEVLKSLCIREDQLTCADKFINGLLEQTSSNLKPCSVKTNLLGRNCSSNCHMDVGRFYNKLGCCVGSVSSIMECYSVKPENDSYGIFVKDGYSRCHLKRPSACSQDTRILCPSSSQRSPTPTPPASSSKGNQIAGISIAVIICLGGAIVVGNFCYRRMKRKAKIRFEDYGYSRLKMLEDDLYFDIEVDDDESKGLVQM